MATTDGTARRSNGSNLFTVTVTPVLDTNAYANLDALHTNDLLLPDMAEVVGGGGKITKVVLTDKADQGAAGILWLFDTALANTTHTVNDAFAPHDTDLATCVGSIVLGAYVDGNTGQVSTNAVTGLPLTYQCAETSTSLYAVLQTTGSPTYAASSLKLTITGEYLRGR